MTFSGSQLTAMDAPLLGVNIDHVATVRNARGGRFPDPVAAAQLAVEGGADIITFHLREDRRHIRDEDVERLKAHIAVPLNFEAAVTDEMLDIIAKRMKERKVDNIDLVLGTESDPKLPANAVDLILLGCVPLAGISAFLATRQVTRFMPARIKSAASLASAHRSTLTHLPRSRSL